MIGARLNLPDAAPLAFAIAMERQRLGIGPACPRAPWMADEIADDPFHAAIPSKSPIWRLSAAFGSGISSGIICHAHNPPFV